MWCLEMSCRKKKTAVSSKEGKQFFFEKKNQKTFAKLVAWRNSNATACIRMPNISTDRLCLVDVGGAGGLQAKWLAYAAQIMPVMFEPNPAEAAKLRDTLQQSFADGLVLETGLSNLTETHAEPRDSEKIPHCAAVRSSAHHHCELHPL